jgi:antitoxin component YwqK of YwqJK toxin-antitoxin module
MLIELRRTTGYFLVAGLVGVLGTLASAQDSIDQPAQDETPEVVPQQESVTIEAYSGPPIFLPEPPQPPPATRVEEKSVTDYYDQETKEQPRVTRTVRRYSDESVKNHGEYQEFYENGQVFAEGRYDEGQPVGEWKYYHPDGSLAKIVTYVDGQPDGAFEVRRADGSLLAKREYAAGKRQGEWAIYGEDGQQRLVESHYNEGKPDGVWQVWYPDGKQRRQVPFADGKQHGTIVEWDDEGNKRAEVVFEQGVREGVSRMWTSDGRVYEQTYEEGRLVSTKELEN